MIGIDALSPHILDSIIELSIKLDLSIVAEGVEITEQHDYLISQGVDFLQGYLFANPLSATDFLNSLNQQTLESTISLQDCIPYLRRRHHHYHQSRTSAI